jgi:hypothetical protein
MVVDEGAAQAPPPDATSITSFLHKATQATAPKQAPTLSEPESEEQVMSNMALHVPLANIASQASPTTQHIQQPTPEQEDVSAVVGRLGKRERMLERLYEIQDGLTRLWETTELVKESLLEEMEDDE